MTEHPTDPSRPVLADDLGDLGDGDTAAEDTNWVDPDADQNTDLMRPDSDPLPDSQVPGAGPDGQAPTTPQV
jgi:hypothetical protein